VIIFGEKSVRGDQNILEKCFTSLESTPSNFLVVDFGRSDVAIQGQKGNLGNGQQALPRFFRFLL
jgi:hypothetical protein